MSSINGIGSRYIGCSDVARDGSYITTKWVIFVHVPVVPLHSIRVWPISHTNLVFYSSSTYQARPVPLYWPQVIWMYATYIAAAIYLFAADRLTGPRTSELISSPLLASLIAFVLAILALWISGFIRKTSLYANLIVFATIITFSLLEGTNMSPLPEKSAQYMYFFWGAYAIFIVMKFLTKKDSKNELPKGRR